MVVIQIIGSPGSGKSWICNEVKNCIDTDDYFVKAYEMLQTNATDKRIAKLATKLLKHDIKKFKNVVVVGHTLQVEKPTYVFFIKMTPKELELSYRRVIKRELQKYVQLTTNQLLNKIDSIDPKKMQVWLYYTYFMGIDPLTLTFSKYKQKYKKLLKNNPDSIKMSQKDIIKKIKTLII